MGWFIIIIIIIIIINEKINVAFSRSTARTRNSHKNKTGPWKVYTVFIKKDRLYFSHISSNSARI